MLRAAQGNIVGQFQQNVLPPGSSVIRPPPALAPAVTPLQNGRTNNCRPDCRTSCCDDCRPYCQGNCRADRSTHCRADCGADCRPHCGVNGCADACADSSTNTGSDICTDARTQQGANADTQSTAHICTHQSAYCCPIPDNVRANRCRMCGGA